LNPVESKLEPALNCGTLLLFWQFCATITKEYTGVTIAPDRFSMRDCNNLCEDSGRVKEYKRSITK